MNTDKANLLFPTPRRQVPASPPFAEPRSSVSSRGLHRLGSALGQPPPERRVLGLRDLATQIVAWLVVVPKASEESGVKAGSLFGAHTVARRRTEFWENLIFVLLGFCGLVGVVICFLGR